jgi:N-ethylmaleimide reductase
MTNDLFQPAQLGDLALRNRIVMAPMTRDRASPGAMPNDVMALYYAQRASAGLIITEGTPPDALGQGYLRVPGLYTEAQAEAWRNVVDGVHARGAKIFVQLMYVGRVSHPSFLGGVTPMGPSAIRAEGSVYTADGPQRFVTPRAMSEAEIDTAIASYGRAAGLAKTAGFDGVELHATSGYLPMQFLLPTINQRTDRWGGELANRARFLLAATDAMVAVLGPNRVGVRIGPEFTFNDAHDPAPKETYAYVIEELNKRAIAYLHVIDTHASNWDVIGWIRARFNGVLIANGGYDREKAQADLDAGRADLISFGAPFVANPDLVARLRTGADLAVADRAALYSDGPTGYVDYPDMHGEAVGSWPHANTQTAA